MNIKMLLIERAQKDGAVSWSYDEEEKKLTAIFYPDPDEDEEVFVTYGYYWLTKYSNGWAYDICWLFSDGSPVGLCEPLDQVV